MLKEQPPDTLMTCPPEGGARSHEVARGGFWEDLFCFRFSGQVFTYRLRNTKLPTEYPAPKEQITPRSPFFKSSL
jgi:hypothetical protein